MHGIAGGYGNPSAYIAAWRHIWTIFHQEGARNVAFVWCPGLSGGNEAAYYPGDPYVDWIGVDGYDRTDKGIGAGTFSGLFGGFYDTWVSHQKPVMIGETAATSFDQAQYIQSIQSSAPAFPDVKAIVYFDSIGPRANWSLQGSGIAAFKNLAGDSYFLTAPN